MRKTTIFLVLLVFGSLCFGQNNYRAANLETRKLSGYTGVEVGAGIKLIITNGNEESVAVSAANPEHVERIETVVEKGILKISFKQPLKKIKKENARDLVAYVSYKKLESLKATTGAKIVTDGVLTAKQLQLDLTTGATMEGKVDIGALSFSQTTGARTVLTGTVDAMNLEGTTGSKFQGKDLAILKCNVEISTGSIYEVHVNESLEAKASTGAKVYYKGAVKNVVVKATTGGKIQKS